MISRNLASGIKLKAGLWINGFLDPDKEIEYTYDVVKLEAVNLVRSQIILLKSYFDQDIVTSKELEINVKMNKPYWLENPAIIASMTAVTNTFLSLSTFQAKLSETPLVNTVARSINNSFIPTLLHSLPITAVAVTGMLTGFLVPVAALGMLALGTYTYNKISNSDYVKIKNRNKELNIKTIKITDEFKNQNLITTNNCGLSLDAPQYYKKFEKALELENNYLTESAQNYDIIVSLSYNFVNIYSIICQDVFQPPPIAQNPVAHPIVEAPIVEAPIVEAPIVQNQEQAETLETKQANIKKELNRLWDKTDRGTKKGNITPTEYQDITAKIRPFIKEKLKLKGDCNNNRISQDNISVTLDEFIDNTSYDIVKGNLCGRKSQGGKTKRSRKGKTQNKRSKKRKTIRRR
jgi:hypothetical protein